MEGGGEGVRLGGGEGVAHPATQRRRSGSCILVDCGGGQRCRLLEGGHCLELECSLYRLQGGRLVGRRQRGGAMVNRNIVVQFHGEGRGMVYSGGVVQGEGMHERGWVQHGGLSHCLWLVLGLHWNLDSKIFAYQTNGIVFSLFYIKHTCCCCCCMWMGEPPLS